MDTAKRLREIAETIEKEVKCVSSEGYPYVIIRSEKMGVHAGYLKSRGGVTPNEVCLVNSRRLFYWDGACSVSQIAVNGVKAPENCKFAITVPEEVILGVGEILFASEKARLSIEGVKIWAR